jgi:hypothetical protein
MVKETMNSKRLFEVCVSVLLIFAGGCTRTGGRPMQTRQQPVRNEVQVEKSQLEVDWGIKVESARLSAAGYMVDFRFRVLDAAKAAQIFDRKTMPHMIDQATGATFIVPTPPKIGQLRSGGNIQEGKIYFIFFANPAKYVKSGNKITVEVGDFKVQDIVVN